MKSLDVNELSLEEGKLYCDLKVVEDTVALVNGYLRSNKTDHVFYDKIKVTGCGRVVGVGNWGWVGVMSRGCE